MPTYTELQAQAEPAKRRIQALDRPRIAVGIDTSSIAIGALATLEALRAEVVRRGLDVAVDRTGGNGLSFANPQVEVAKPDGSRVLYQHVRAEEAGEYVE